MKNDFFKFMICLLGLAACSMGSKAQEMDPDLERENLEAAIVVLDKVFKENGLFKVTEKDVRMFHWEDRNNFNEEEQRSAIVREVKRFWAKDAAKGFDAVVGPGIYAAADPFMTDSYGDTLFEYFYSKGSVYLDLAKIYRYDSVIDLNITDKALLEKAGCKSIYINQENFLRGGENCVKIIQRVLKKNKVKFISYYYDTNSRFNKANGCPDWAGAFLIIGLDKLISYGKMTGSPGIYLDKYRSYSDYQEWLHSLFHCP